MRKNPKTKSFRCYLSKWLFPERLSKHSCVYRLRNTFKNHDSFAAQLDDDSAFPQTAV
jgi:hypothetical protein